MQNIFSVETVKSVVKKKELTLKACNSSSLRQLLLICKVKDNLDRIIRITHQTESTAE